MTEPVSPEALRATAAMLGLEDYDFGACARRQWALRPRERTSGRQGTPAARWRRCSGLLGAFLAVSALAGCSYINGSFETSAGGAPPTPVQAANATPTPPPADIPPDQASCRLSGSFTSLNFLTNTSLGVLDQHSNPDGSVDTRSLNYGRQVDPAAGQAIGGIISLAGMLGKGAMAAGTGGMMALPDQHGVYHAVPVPGAQQPPPAAWKSASAAGCIPNVSAPGGSVGPQPQADDHPSLRPLPAEPRNRAEPLAR
jgi:hypothetical protein